MFDCCHQHVVVTRSSPLFPADCGHGAPHQQPWSQHQLHLCAVRGRQATLRGRGEDPDHESALPQGWISEGGTWHSQFLCPICL